ncbi:helix-turn-helix domain-containing protein [Vibrio breoganii]
MLKENEQEFLDLLLEVAKHDRSRLFDQQELASRAGVSRTTVSNFERGKPVSSHALIGILSEIGTLSVLQDALLTYRESLGTKLNQRKTVSELDNDF